MKTLLKELVAAVILLSALTVIHAQSDCGNCWFLGRGCNYDDGACDIGAPVCASCYDYYACDNASCNYSIGPYCYCIAENAVPCVDGKVKALASNQIRKLQYLARIRMAKIKVKA